MDAVCQFRMDKEIASKSISQKQVRDLESQVQDIQEDLEAEREGRNKAEKHRRDLGEVRWSTSN